MTIRAPLTDDDAPGRSASRGGKLVALVRRAGRVVARAAQLWKPGRSDTARAHGHPYRSDLYRDEERPRHRNTRPWWIACDLGILAAVCAIGSGRVPHLSPASEPYLSPASEPYSAHVALFRDFDGAPLDDVTIDIAGVEGQVRYEWLMDRPYVVQGTMSPSAIALLRPDLERLLGLDRIALGRSGSLHVVMNGHEWTSRQDGPMRAARVQGTDPGDEPVARQPRDEDVVEVFRIERQIARAARIAAGLPEDEP